MKKSCANCNRCGLRYDNEEMILQCEAHPEVRFGWLSDKSNDKVCKDWEKADLPF